MIKRLSLALNVPHASINKWAKLISTFVVGQGAVQLIQVLSGFFLIRWLSVEEYAQYSVAFAFQSTAQMLVEFGFSGSIVALVGDRIYNKKVIGNYIKAGQFYRNRFFVIVGGACIILFPLLTAKHHWPLTVTIALLICILSNLFFSGNISYYTPPLLIHQRLHNLYRIQLKNGILRFLLIAVLYLFSVLNAWLAALTTSLLTVVNGYAYKKKASAFIEEPQKASVIVRKEMFDYIRPIMPGIVFAAFQGQIMIFIISFFGQTMSIAEIGALSRLGQLYLIFGVAGSALVAPYIAKQGKKDLLTKYATILSLYLVLSVALIALAYMMPNLFLWIIGSNYSHLNTEVLLLITNSGLALIVGIMWQMNAARKWIFYWMPIVSIPGTLLVQIVCILYLNLSQTSEVLMLSIFTNLFVLFTRVLVGLVGFKKDNVL
ncbi:hypothetical protein WJR50_29410 [Catalinimonas sp. 4WD22]|uniref:hypothetical protein n=1 Tax=Catalinimonas locisalis TaxID=3133978 RepID=UPI003101207C